MKQECHKIRQYSSTQVKLAYSKLMSILSIWIICNNITLNVWNWTLMKMNSYIYLPIMSNLCYGPGHMQNILLLWNPQCVLIKTSFNERGRPQKGFPLDAYPKVGKWRKDGCATLQECVKEQECAKYNFKMQITPLI